MERKRQTASDQGKSSRGKGTWSGRGRGRIDGGRRREFNNEGSKFATDGHGDKSQNRSRPSTAGKTKLSWIPQEYMGLVIGKHGANLTEISQESGAVLERINRDIYISGSPKAQEQATQMIHDLISATPKNKQSVKMCSVPEECMGAIIGKNGYRLRTIQEETKTRLKIRDHEIEMFGVRENQLKARLKIKEIISSVLANRDDASTKRISYIERSCVREDSNFTLKQVETPYGFSPSESFYRIQPTEEDMLAEVRKDREVRHDGLKNDLLQILRKLHREKDECDIEIDMWYHFGRVYLRGIDEASEGVYFSLDDIESKIKPAVASDKRQMWGTKYRNGITKMELDLLEKNLEESARSPTDDHRWDLSFLTPTYRHVRAKVWLNKAEQDQATADVGSYSFATAPPVSVRNQLLRVSSGENESESSPSFFLCKPHQRRFVAEIILPGYRFDCRLVLRTNEIDASANQLPYEKEEDKIITDYLSQMQLDKNSGLITLPPAIEDFDISYKRRSLRRTYSYDVGNVPCSLTVSKEEEKTDKEADCDKCVDIHLHCDKWDQLLKEGNWEPEEIVQILPEFLQFVTSVQGFLRFHDKPDIELEP